MKQLHNYCSSTSCQIQEIFRRSGTPTTTIVAYRMTMDKVELKQHPSVGVLPEVDPAIRFPVQVAGDGNCRPRAGSMIAFGDEIHFTDMRL
ncbi:hypothetical protein LSAT2_006157, partial [Lamellibrachia satsuma]